MRIVGIIAWLLYSFMSTLLFAAPETLDWHVSDKGEITNVRARGDILINSAEFKLVGPNWKKIVPFRNAKFAPSKYSSKSTELCGKLSLGSKTLSFRQHTQNSGKTLHLTALFEASARIRAEGVFFCQKLPLGEFAGGNVELLRDRKTVARNSFPDNLDSALYVIAHEKADKIIFTDKLDSFRLIITLKSPVYVRIQDDRKFGAADYQVLITVKPGPLQPQQTVKFDCSFSAEFKPCGKVQILGPTKSVLQGIGGNFCFATSSWQTKYMLRHLNFAGVRIEMPLDIWEPVNDNSSPAKVNWTRFKQQDRPESQLRHKFQLARKLARESGPLVISVWRLPFWLYSDPRNRDKDQHHRTVPRRNWPEMFESIITFLVYARDKYQVEPDYFSFNEPDIGINVYFTPDDYAAMIQQLAQSFKKANLKTAILLGDVSNPRQTWLYLEPALREVADRKVVKALSCHSWGGGTPEDYRHWRGIAEKYHIPLLITEVGVDPHAWKNDSYNTWSYSIAEARMYMNLLRYARPAGTMQWEFTADYALVETGKKKPKPTDRFYFIKHLAELTPPGSVYLEIACNNRFLSCCALRKNRQTIIHIMNAGSEQLATIESFADFEDVTIIRSSRKSKYQPSGSFCQESKNKMKILLPSQSLSTIFLYPPRYTQK